jgi:hypothetical protein
LQSARNQYSAIGSLLAREFKAWYVFAETSAPMNSTWPSAKRWPTIFPAWSLEGPHVRLVDPEPTVIGEAAGGLVVVFDPLIKRSRVSGPLHVPLVSVPHACDGI